MFFDVYVLFLCVIYGILETKQSHEHGHRGVLDVEDENPAPPMSDDFFTVLLLRSSQQLARVSIYTTCTKVPVDLKYN